jgi:hypothetical protein
MNKFRVHPKKESSLPRKIPTGCHYRLSNVFADPEFGDKLISIVL